MEIILWIYWKLKGSPYIKYTGYNCGCCGEWINQEISIPTYQSEGTWWDTWGICDKCKSDPFLKGVENDKTNNTNT